MCQTESLEYSCIDKFCKKIHFSTGEICWYYVFQQSCKFGVKCSNSHLLRNCELIKKRGLTSLNETKLRKLLRLSKQNEIKFCKSIDTCKTFDCSSLHCCFHYYVHENCDNKNDCKSGHDFNLHLDHNVNVLSKKGLDNLKDNDDLKTYLAYAYFGIKKRRVNSKIVTPLFNTSNSILYKILSIIIKDNIFHIDFDTLCRQIHHIDSYEIRDFIKKDKSNFFLFDKFDGKEVLIFIPVSYL